jgi:FKBP-type peptidyl-prolyl cis-trans isomerase FklB
MKSNYMKLFLLAMALLAAGLLVSFRSGRHPPDLTQPTQRINYALGMGIAAKLRQQEADIDLRALAAGMADMQAGTPALAPDRAKTAMKEFKQDLNAKAEAKKKVAAARNLKEGQAFLAANAQKPGVKVIAVTAPDGSPAQVQYQVLQAGAGPSPEMTDILRLHYEGRTLDGRVFDSSLQRGVPWTGRANDFIPGWTAALQMMSVGAKWRLFIPPSLGYGEFVPYKIGPDSTLIYDIELLGIQKPAAPAN